jgi:tetratricopeptide (TPR) repeat protein
MADFKIIRSAVLLFLVFLVCGCPEKNNNVGNEIPPVGSDLRKIELQRRLDRKYNDANIHYELGKIYQSEGQWDKARFEFKTARSYKPANWDSAAAIVKTYYQDGKNDTAIAMAEKFVKKAGYSAASSLSLGKAFQNEMLGDEALTCYSQALKIAPNSAEVNKQIGYYYYEKNDLIRAEQYLRRSFEIHPSGDVSGALGRLGITVNLPRSELDQPENTDQPKDVK